MKQGEYISVGIINEYKIVRNKNNKFKTQILLKISCGIVFQ